MPGSSILRRRSAANFFAAAPRLPRRSSVPGYNLDNADPQKMMNWMIAKDVLLHLERIIDACSFRKLDKRSGINQAAYAIAKRFGHLSSSPDLYLWHPSLAKNELFFQGDECITVPNVEGVTLCYRLWVLGKQSQKASHKLQQSADPNEVCIYIVGGGRARPQVNVTIDVSGPALLQLCVDNGRIRTLAPRLRDMLKAKWGSTGVTFNNVDPSERIGQKMAYTRSDALKNIADHGELYLYRRYVGGVLKNWDDGVGWIL